MTPFWWWFSGFLSAVAVILVFVFFRYIPIIERNAFEVPRFQAPKDSRPPANLKRRKFKIPYDTRRAITAEYIRAKEPSRRLVVFCHETGADLNSWYRHAYFLPENGVDVLTFDFKPRALDAHKTEEEAQPYQWPTLQDLRCLERVLSWVALQRQGYEVALFGISKGATVAAAAAPSPLIRSVLLDGAFSTHLTLKHYMKKWVNIYVSPKRIADGVPDWVYILLSMTTLFYASVRKNLSFFSIERFIVKLTKPVFWIHAAKDYHVRLEHVERLRKRIPGVTDLWVAEGAGHSQAVLRHPEEYHRRVVSFIDKTFSG
ncbi:MAG: alpha/beta hydrolase [Candidatus Omnitrophica bacterium]|nr:alpha/beta hydrolase [Candidatus Omnitrophota bacterium]